VSHFYISRVQGRIAESFAASSLLTFQARQTRSGWVTRSLRTKPFSSSKSLVNALRAYATSTLAMITTAYSGRAERVAFGRTRSPVPRINTLLSKNIIREVSWTYYHNIIYSLLFFIRFNCVSETPSHSLLTVKETAQYLRIPLPTVYYLVQRGQIPAIQIGGRWRIKKSSLDRDILREDKQGQPTVLVVDDDLGIQELFKTFLKKTGFSRVVVGTAKEAISSLRKQKFDLMFLDLQLPDEPGDQVYKTAKQIDPGLNVIVITGYPDSKVLDRILQISPVTVLKKPLKIEQLNQTVKMLGHEAALVEA
jgi:excisionase family DNA binding protein